METEEVFKTLSKELGGFRKFQVWALSISCTVYLLCGLSVVNYVFTGFNVLYRCAVPECEDVSNSSYTKDFLNFTTPYEDDPETKWSSCNTFDFNSTKTMNSSAICEPDSFIVTRNLKCSQWVYDTSLFKETLVSEFDLTCDRAWLLSLCGSAFMFGMPFGAAIIGDLADRIGRRKAMVISVAIWSIGELTAAFAVHVFMYFGSRLLSGAGVASACVIAMIQAIEASPSRYRARVGATIQICFPVGCLGIAAFAYFIREWRWLQLSLAIPIFSALSFWWIMPESYRWLIVKGNFDEARIVINKAATINKVHIAEHTLKEMFLKVEEAQNRAKNEQKENTLSQRSVLDIFKHKRLRLRTLILMFSWIAVTLDYYGLNISSASFGTDPFISFVAVMTVEIPSYIFSVYALDKFGRKGCMVFLTIFGGLICAASFFVDRRLSLVILIMNLIGKFCIAAAFLIIYVFTIELYPTHYRSLGLGLCSMAARVGGILAPFTSGLSGIHKQFPLIIFGVMAIVSGLLMLMLPETTGREMPQTLEESEEYGKDQSLFYFTCCEKKKRISKPR